ncbi:VanW family protein [Patescibacteria group bacterium]|nr:VanW family protein [Patescibacteria group bacterium]
MIFFKKKERIRVIFDAIVNSIVGVFIFLIILAILLTIVIFAYLVFEKKYESRIYPGVFLKNIDLSGMDYDESSLALKKEIEDINQNGILFYYYDFNSLTSDTLRKTTLYPLVSSFTGDIAYQVIDFNINEAVDQAFGIGRNKKLLDNIKDKVDAYLHTVQVDVHVDVNEEEIEKILKTYFKQFEIPAQDAQLLTKKNNNNEIVFAVTKEQNGYVINYQDAIVKLKDNLENLDTSPIELVSLVDEPLVYQEDGLKVAERANGILSFAPFTLFFEGYPKLKVPTRDWPIERDELALWLVIKKGDGDGTVIGFNGTVKEYFENNISAHIGRVPKDAKLEVKNGKVVEFQTGVDGLELDVEKTIANLEERIIDRTHNLIVKETNDARRIKVEYQEVSAKHTNDINDMGIKEVIGVGGSSFAGSPSNRRHNIKTGIDSLNGLIIEPNEEFSLIKALGSIDAEGGYKPELVIKGGKTLPEFGGGLCQVGTTLFRAVLAAGLPVTERRNHSYRVGYYEPAGTDATIYDPWPDFKFVNDTNKYLLLQTFMEGDELRFEFWGTQDGRVSSTSDPVIYNIVQPGPKKVIETTDLPLGVEKCTERAHAGADAYFDYSILDKNGELRERRFSSHYVPWQEVCLIGVEESLATTTDENILKEKPTL